jgi:hypothetical protein
MSTGGSIEAVEIRGRVFAVAADADATRKFGGFENEVQLNGDGTARIVKTRVGWSITGLTISIDDMRADQEFLQDIANGKDADPDGFYSCSVTFASGATYSGRGIVTDAVEGASQNSTLGCSLTGPGTLTKQ